METLTHKSVRKLYNFYLTITSLSLYYSHRIIQAENVTELPRDKWVIRLCSYYIFCNTAKRASINEELCFPKWLIKPYQPRSIPPFLPSYEKTSESTTKLWWYETFSLWSLKKKTDILLSTMEEFSVPHTKLRNSTWYNLKHFITHCQLCIFNLIFSCYMSLLRSISSSLKIWESAC